MSLRILAAICTVAVATSAQNEHDAAPAPAGSRSPLQRADLDDTTFANVAADVPRALISIPVTSSERSSINKYKQFRLGMRRFQEIFIKQYLRLALTNAAAAAAIQSSQKQKVPHADSITRHLIERYLKHADVLTRHLPNFQENFKQYLLHRELDNTTLAATAASAPRSRFRITRSHMKQLQEIFIQQYLPMALTTSIIFGLTVPSAGQKLMSWTIGTWTMVPTICVTYIFFFAGANLKMGEVKKAFQAIWTLLYGIVTINFITPFLAIPVSMLPFLAHDLRVGFVLFLQHGDFSQCWRGNGKASQSRCCFRASAGLHNKHHWHFHCSFLPEDVAGRSRSNTYQPSPDLNKFDLDGPPPSLCGSRVQIYSWGGKILG